MSGRLVKVLVALLQFECIMGRLHVFDRGVTSEEEWYSVLLFPFPRVKRLNRLSI